MSVVLEAIPVGEGRAYAVGDVQGAVYPAPVEDGKVLVDL